MATDITVVITPITGDMAITEGMAGIAEGITAITAVIADITEGIAGITEDAGITEGMAGMVEGILTGDGVLQYGRTTGVLTLITEDTMPLIVMDIIHALRIQMTVVASTIIIS